MRSPAPGGYALVQGERHFAVIFLCLPAGRQASFFSWQEKKEGVGSLQSSTQCRRERVNGEPRFSAKVFWFSYSSRIIHQR